MIAAPVFSWGPAGHRIIARIAEHNLTPAAREAIQKILGPNVTLASVSVWADDIRPQRKESSPWHYINVPITAKKGALDQYCPSEGCVTRRVEELIAALKSGQGSATERAEALKYLVHFVGDMHQPLHVGENRDRGGNEVRVEFFGAAANLHRIWDSDILGRITSDDEAYTAELEKKIGAGQNGKWSKGSIVDWAWESREASRKVAYGKLPKQRPAVVAAPYQKAAAPVVRIQLQKGGVRLAKVLNGIWPQ